VHCSISIIAGGDFQIVVVVRQYTSSQTNSLHCNILDH
jgi:hypothetical protein